MRPFEPVMMMRVIIFTAKAQRCKDAMKTVLLKFLRLGFLASLR
jgi:hypothetical protein